MAEEEKTKIKRRLVRTDQKLYPTDKQIQNELRQLTGGFEYNLRDDAIQTAVSKNKILRNVKVEDLYRARRNCKRRMDYQKGRPSV